MKCVLIYTSMEPSTVNLTNCKIILYFVFTFCRDTFSDIKKLPGTSIQGIPYEIDDDVEIWPTPGHTGSDVSVVVRNTNLGTVAVTGESSNYSCIVSCSGVVVIFFSQVSLATILVLFYLMEL